MKTHIKLSMFLLLVLSGPLLQAKPVTKPTSFSPYVDSKGNISLPVNFRLNMIHLGSWYVPEGDASGFHDVYTERESANHYLKTGAFPDGATVVKELRTSLKADYSTGQNVRSATSKIKQWFVMIKDTQGRFKENKTWGDGWGWALIKPDNPNKNVTSDYYYGCIGCHAPAKNTDWIYVDGYPTLHKQ